MSSRRGPRPASGASRFMLLLGAARRYTSTAVAGKGAKRPQRDLAVIRSPPSQCSVSQLGAPRIWYFRT
jgi:hypothetical protein